MDRYRLPQGVGDCLPPTMYRRIELENKLSKLFFSRGYDPVDTSVLENAATYRGAVGAVDDKTLFQLKDTDGSLIVLRADMTLPLSRIAATKLSEEYPLRLCYVSPSYNLVTPKKNRDREFRQAGVELFGIASPEADAEVVSLAADALKTAGLRDYLIDLGQVGIVKGILKELAEEKQLEIVSLIDKKNLITADAELPEETARILNEVVSLYGGAEVFDKAESLLGGYAESLRALKNLKEVYSILKDRGYERYLSVDLSLVNSYSYYSGVVFKGLSASFGDTLLGGGRYDRLLENYGKSVPATGMSLGIRAVMTALLNAGAEDIVPKTDLAVGAEASAKAEAARFAEAERQRGLRVSNSFSETRKGLLEYAARVSSKRAAFFTADGKKEELL